ncbi:MAG: ribonuclease P protein component [Gemmatimonadaceae bacterium]
MKFLAVVARKDVSGLLSNCLRSTLGPKSLGFPRSIRLTSEADLEALRRTGKRMQTERLEARAAASLLPHPRVGIVVPKHRRKIVERNLVKRRLRELVRIDLLPVLPSVDLLIRAKADAYGSSFEQLAGDVDTIGKWASRISR